MTIRKQREVIQDRYTDLTYEKFHAFFSVGSFFDYCFFGEQIPEGDKTLDIFHYFFSLSDGDAKCYLWNLIFSKCVLWGTDRIIINKDLLIADEYEFLSKLVRAAKEEEKREKNDIYFGLLNINKPIKVDNKYILMSPTKEQSDYYHNYFRNNPEDFEQYYSFDFEQFKNSFEDKSFCSLLYRPLFFSVVDIETNSFLGIVGIGKDGNKEEKPLNIEYFVFKPYRRKGIAFKCVSKIIKKLFSGELSINKETKYFGIYKEGVKFKPLVLNAGVAANNVASINLLKKLGFIYRKTNKNYFELKGEKIDEERYILRQK